jgi:hypothetical protein
MGDRSELIWEIICWLWFDEDDALGIASELSKTRTEVNSILYNRRDLFTKRDSANSARPRWSLTNDGIGVYDLIYVNDEVMNMPLFCDECGALSPSHHPTCGNFTLEFKLQIPSKINFGKELGLPGFFGIRYSEKDTDIAVNNRREILIEFLITIFVPVESNSTYVKSYGEPRKQRRRMALINHLQGINVPATSTIQQLRNDDIDWLSSLDLENDLP